MNFTGLHDFLMTTVPSEKILLVILPILLSGFLLPTIVSIWKYFFYKRRTQRIKTANEELTKILIFYIVEGPQITKETIQSLKEGLALKHNITVEDIQPIETSLKKTHSYILLSNEFSISQKNRFYFYFKKRSDDLIVTDYQKEKVSLSKSKLIIRPLKIIAIIWAIYFISAIISSFYNTASLSMQEFDIISTIIITGILSVFAFIFSEMVFKLLRKISLWF